MPEVLYVDSSAFVKLYVEEDGRDEALTASEHASLMATSRIAYVEVGRALSLKAADEAERDDFRETWATDWRSHRVVDLDQGVAEHALALAAHHGLRSADAIHLASALALPAAPLRFATWDQRLWEAARAVGLRVVPARAPGT